jgi:hypothetical protein
MRHIGSLLVAAVFAPSIFLLTGTGLSAFASALDDDKAYDPLGALAAFSALLLAGVLYGILVMARLSPLGPATAGLAAWGMSGWAMFDIDAYRDLFSNLDVHMGGAVGEWGLGILLGTPLVATMFSRRRWVKRKARPVSEPDPTWVLPAAPVYQSTYDIPPPSLRYPVTPDVAPPSLRYPRVVPPLSTPPVSAPPAPARPVSTPPVSAPPVSAPPASTPPVSAPPASAPPGSVKPVMVPASEAPPLPRRVPTPPPAAAEDDGPTERLDTGGSGETTNRLS